MTRFRFWIVAGVVLAVGIAIASGLSLTNQAHSQSDLPPKSLNAAKAPTVYFKHGPDGRLVTINGPDVIRLQEQVEKRHSALGTNRYLLGVAVHPLQAGLHKHLGIVEGQGLLISNVQVDSAADSAGVRKFDILLEIDGVPLKMPLDLISRLQVTQDAPVRLLILRDGQRQEINVTPTINEAFRPDSSSGDSPFDAGMDAAIPDASHFRLIYPGLMPEVNPRDMQALRIEIDQLKLQQGEIMKKLDELLKAKSQ